MSKSLDLSSFSAAVETMMRSMQSFNILFFIFLLSLLSYFPHWVNSYEIGERIGLSSRSSHANKQNAWRTDWVDMPPYLAPRFAEVEEIVFHGVLLLPKGYEKNGNTTLSEGVGGGGGDDGELVIQADSVPYKINPEVDFRVGLAFDNHRHHIPWLTVFNAQQRRRLQKLEVTFLHDSYEIIDIRYQTTYGPRLDNIDPSHPALRGFQLFYRWQSLEEEDFPLGQGCLLTITLCCFFVLASLTIYWSAPDKIQSNGNIGSRTFSGNSRTFSGGNSDSGKSTIGGGKFNVAARS